MSVGMWNGSYTSAEFWYDWVTTEFGLGPSDAGYVANLLIAHESFNLPRPVSWVGGPGGFAPDKGT